MTVEVIYTCDRCKGRVTEPGHLWAVAVVVLDHRRFQPHSSASTHGNCEHSRQWCDACVRQVGILPTPKETAKEVAPTLRLEDLVREIVQDEIANAAQA